MSLLNKLMVRLGYVPKPQPDCWIEIYTKDKVKVSSIQPLFFRFSAHRMYNENKIIFPIDRSCVVTHYKLSFNDGTWEWPRLFENSYTVDPGDSIVLYPGRFERYIEVMYNESSIPAESANESTINYIKDDHHGLHKQIPSRT